MTTPTTCEHELHGNAIRTRLCGAPAVRVITDTDGVVFAGCHTHATQTPFHDQPAGGTPAMTTEPGSSNAEAAQSPAVIDVVHPLISLEVDTAEDSK